MDFSRQSVQLYNKEPPFFSRHGSGLRLVSLCSFELHSPQGTESDLFHTWKFNWCPFQAQLSPYPLRHSPSPGPGMLWAMAAPSWTYGAGAASLCFPSSRSAVQFLIRGSPFWIWIAVGSGFSRALPPFIGASQMKMDRCAYSICQFHERLSVLLNSLQVILQT